MKKIGIALIVLAVTVSLGLSVLTSPVAAGGRPLSAVLLGANEVGGGDPDGSGMANVTLNQGQGEVCFNLSHENIATPTRAHIHRGAAGVNGPIVVAFFDFVDPPPSQGCVGDIDKDLIKEIRQNPESFYVNVHNADFPGGAIRGQLEK
jgi:hypothetical protein